MKRIGILGDFNASNPTHLATDAAIRHSAAHLGSPVEGRWVATDDVSPGILEDFQGIWISPGSPSVSAVEDWGLRIEH